MLSSRNLFAIDYMQENPKTTTREFTIVYDALDEATKEVCAMFLDSCILPLQLIASGLIRVQRHQQSTPHRINRLYRCMRARGVCYSLRVYAYDITVAPPIGGLCKYN
jgi:hypothetical protein